MLAQSVFKCIDLYRNPISAIGLHVLNWNLPVNRMRMRSPSSTHNTLFVIALTRIGCNASPFLRFIYRYCLFPVTVAYHLLSKINCSFLLWEKNQLGKAKWCLSQRLCVENDGRRQLQKRNSCNCVILITNRINNERKKNTNVHRPKWCGALFKSSFFIHKNSCVGLFIILGLRRRCESGTDEHVEKSVESIVSNSAHEIVAKGNLRQTQRYTYAKWKMKINDCPLRLMENWFDIHIIQCLF